MLGLAERLLCLMVVTAFAVQPSLSFAPLAKNIVRERSSATSASTTQFFVLSTSRDIWKVIVKDAVAHDTADELADKIVKELEQMEKEKEDWKNQSKEWQNQSKEWQNQSKEWQKRVLAAEVELLRFKAQNTAETNLRPILEQFAAKNWYRKHKKQKAPGVQKMINQFVTENGKEVDDNIEKALEFSKHLGTAYEYSKSKVRDEIYKLYDALSEVDHTTNISADCPVGFVVNMNPKFSLAMSTILMCAGETHTVMTNEYLTVVYRWPPSDGETLHGSNVGDSTD